MLARGETAAGTGSGVRSRQPIEIWSPIVLPEGDDADRAWGADPSELLESLIGRPSWHERASCRGEGPVAWFPGPGADLSAAIRICGRCPVREECLKDAMSRGERADSGGIWGGTTAQERRRLRKANAAAA
jgi:WhiB family redox-sensing transcriptional regulator